MYCKNCGEMIEYRCNFCPNCGHPVDGSRLNTSPNTHPGHTGLTGMDNLFEDIERELKKLEEMFRNISIGEDIRPGRGIPGKYTRKSGGISIRISSGPDSKPKIDVNTFGDYKGHESEIKERFGAGAVRKPKNNKVQRSPPKVIKEPETAVSHVGDRVILRINAPDVKSLKDVDIKVLQESVEIRAYAGDKAYFTLFTAPEGTRVLKKKLEKGELIIEMSLGNTDT